jgi:hypothetical protein
MYFVLYLILSLILLTKQITMTPEDRQKEQESQKILPYINIMYGAK